MTVAATESAPRAVPAEAASTPRAQTPRPFLKWAGGKSQLLPALLAHIPAGIETYYEPFIGGGALFFALMADPERRPRRAVLNDLNPDLVATYTYSPNFSIQFGYFYMWYGDFVQNNLPRGNAYQFYVMPTLRF